jgi:hypothetical protein
MLIVCRLLVLWHPSAPVGCRHDNALPSVTVIAIYRNPITWVMRSGAAFSGRAETRVSLRQNALDPGFHDVPTGPAYPDRGVDDAGVT